MQAVLTAPDRTTLTPTDLARIGKLDGLNLAGLVRMSHETKHKDDDESGNDHSNRAYKPFTGEDINNCDEQEKFCRRYTEVRGGKYVYTYDEPDTSAWKRSGSRLLALTAAPATFTG